MELDKYIEKFNMKRESLMNPLLHIAKEQHGDALTILSGAFQNIGFSMCGTDEVVSIDEAKIIAALSKLFPEMQSISPESWLGSLNGKSDDEWVDIHSRGRHKFGAVYLLEIHDQDNGTDHAETLKQLLLEFAIMMAGADGEISPAEVAYLQEIINGNRDA